MTLSGQRQGTAFSVWMRTGRWPRREAAENVEVKFNPWHDPRNGQFTFGPGGPTLPHRSPYLPREHRKEGEVQVSKSKKREGLLETDQQLPRDALHQSSFQVANGTHFAAAISGGPAGRAGGGSNSRAFIVPMTLVQFFPGLNTSTQDRIFAAADNLLDLTGPARQIGIEYTERTSQILIRKIRELNPKYEYRNLAPYTPQTPEGQANQINSIRMDLAISLMRYKNDFGPLQVETIRFVQRVVDRAYDEGMSLIRRGKIPINISERLTLGNYIDRQTRTALRNLYNRYGIEWYGKGPVRVNRREYDTSGTDSTYVNPDARVSNAALDWTLMGKDLSYPQIRRFFRSDFQPDFTIIIRPSQIDPGNTYAIARPGTKR